jgi:hypothetical protein
MSSDTDHAIQLLTANLAYRTAAVADPKATPEYDTYMSLLREISGSPRGGGVFMEMTELAARAIVRLAAATGEDPMALWQSIALDYAQQPDDGREYLDRMPEEIPAGMLLIHNNVRPTRRLGGSRGFRAWLEEPGAGPREVCECSWAPELGPHYRVALEEGPSRRGL